MCAALHKLCVRMLWQGKGKPRFGSPLKWITIIRIKDCSRKEHSWHMYTRYDAIYMYFLYSFIRKLIWQKGLQSPSIVKIGLIWIRNVLFVIAQLLELCYLCTFYISLSFLNTALSQFDFENKYCESQIFLSQKSQWICWQNSTELLNFDIFFHAILWHNSCFLRCIVFL